MCNRFHYGHKGKIDFEMTTTNIFFTYRLVLKVYKLFVTTYKREGDFRAVSTAIITVLRAKMEWIGVTSMFHFPEL